MALNDNNKEIIKRAARDLSLKLQLEDTLKPSLKRLFKNIIDHFKIKYAQGGSQEIIKVEDYQAELVAILRAHYRRVSKVFLKVDEKQIKSLDKKDAISDAVQASMAEFILVHSENQASIILRTVKDELDTAILKTIQTSIENNKEPDAQTIANLVYDDFSKKIDGKAEIIAITETQTIAEKTKQEEYQAISTVGDPTSQLFIKQWVSILDNRTRPWHARADGQRVPLTEPFTVKGEKLMYPGDTSFGVSLDNIINCRCSHLLVKLD